MIRQTTRGPRNLTWLTLGALLLISAGVLQAQKELPAPRPAQAQIQIAPQADLIPADEGADPSLTPRADIDKDLSKAMRKAEEYRDRGDFDSAVEIVQRYVLDQKLDDDGKPSESRSADYFTDQSMKTSLKRQALELIGGLPAAGRRVYELKFGPAARALLEDAIAVNDMTQVETVTRQYFHTRAGYEAAYLLGTHKLDQGEPLAAALHFAQLRQMPEVASSWEPTLSLKAAIAWHRAGDAEQAVETLLALKRIAPQGRLSLGQRNVPLFAADDEAEGWLTRVIGPPVGQTALGQRNWTMFRADPVRSSIGSPASPAGDVVWEFPTIRDIEALPPKDPRRLAAFEQEMKRLAEIEQQLLQMEAEKRGNGFLTLPAVHPLVIGDAVVFRTMRNLRAVHLKTGKLLWETSIISKPYEQLIASSTPAAMAAAAVRVNQNQATTLESLLSQRAWLDLAAGTLSSDGRYVYALEAMGYLSANRATPAPWGFPWRRPTSTSWWRMSWRPTASRCGKSAGRASSASSWPAPTFWGRRCRSTAGCTALSK
jgi:tetratricopeptide (TPR) repeat protein